jgi:hypothetical protein
MSLPAAMSAQGLTAMAPINPIEGFLQIFNSNPYFIGIMMLILNLGGRFISLEVTKKQEQFLQLPWVRRGLIFTVLFVATRNIWVAFWATVTVILFLGYLFNENSALCIFGQGGKAGSKCDGQDGPKPGEEMTPEEKEILQRLSAKAQRYQTGGANNGATTIKNPEQLALDKSLKQSGANDEEEDVLHTDVYAANLTLLRNPV